MFTIPTDSHSVTAKTFGFLGDSALNFRQISCFCFVISGLNTSQLLEPCWRETGGRILPSSGFSRLLNLTACC